MSLASQSSIIAHEIGSEFYRGRCVEWPLNSLAVVLMTEVFTQIQNAAVRTFP